MARWGDQWDEGPLLSSPSSDSLLSHVEQLLRAFILKISVCDAVLDHNPPGVLAPTPSSLGVSMATLAESGSYLASPGLLSSFLPFRTPPKVHFLQEASLMDFTWPQSPC